MPYVSSHLTIHLLFWMSVKVDERIMSTETMLDLYFLNYSFHNSSVKLLIKVTTLSEFNFGRLFCYYGPTTHRYTEEQIVPMQFPALIQSLVINLRSTVNQILNNTTSSKISSIVESLFSLPPRAILVVFTQLVYNCKCLCLPSYPFPFQLFFLQVSFSLVFAPLSDYFNSPYKFICGLQQLNFP